MTPHNALRLLRTLISEAVAQKSDVYYEHKVVDLARDAAHIFRKPNQMKNLERTALNALALADLVNFVKTQAGRSTQTGRSWRERDFARSLHDALWETVRKDADAQARAIWRALRRVHPEAIEALKERGYDESNTRRELRLQLGRTFVQHLVAQYTYNEQTHA